MSDAVQTDTLTAMPAVVRWVAGLAFVLAVPLFLVLGNVLDVANDRQFYADEFVKYNVGAVTGLFLTLAIVVVESSEFGYGKA